MGLKLNGSPFLLHDIDSLLLGAQLAINVIDLATKPLRNLLLLHETLLQGLVLDHLVRGAAAKVSDLRVQLTLQIVQPDILVLHLVVLVLKRDPLALLCLVLNNQVFLLAYRLRRNTLAVIAHFYFGLVLLEHAQLKTPDLIFNVFVVVFHLAASYNSPHQLLQLLVFHLLCVLCVRALLAWLSWRRPLLLPIHFQSLK